jgi:epoxyqueuosine reductase
MQRLEDRLKRRAQELGFELVGIAPAKPADGLERLREWLNCGFAGEMKYMHRQASECRDPSSVFPGVRSVVMVGMSYKPAEEPVADEFVSKTGKVARYARGADYHDVLRARLGELLCWVQGEVPGAGGRGVVDTAPLLERDFARRAGLGWFGKNTMLIDRRLGSYFFLGALLLDIDLESDSPHSTSHCGTCTACLDACPTSAFVEPGVLDSRRCLSYLTIELRRHVPEEMRMAMNEWLFGCDICQEVCPWNRKAPSGKEAALASRGDLEAIDLVELFTMSEETFRQRFKGTALWRARRRGLLRNAALILGNRRDRKVLAVLETAANDHDEVIREAARWAIERIREHATPGSADSESRPNC